MVDGSAWLAGAGVVLLLLFLLWGISLAIQNASIVDLFWGTGFVILGWIAYLGSPNTGRAQIVLGLVSIWGLRLCVHLARRNLGHGEDRRYRAMREARGRSFWWQSLFIVFILQGLLMSFIALPLFACMNSTTPLGWLDGIGAALFTVGFGFETVGDWQLSRFLADDLNRGRVMNRGLWRYTRHPNYFGDALLWWGFGVFALAAESVWTLAAPLLMSFLLMRVSGVRLLEENMSERRPDYAAYVRSTNAFFPGPPRGDHG